MEVDTNVMRAQEGRKMKDSKLENIYFGRFHSVGQRGTLTMSCLEDHSNN